MKNPTNLHLNESIKDKEPLYVQVKTMMQKKIVSGRFSTGCKLPSIQALVKENLVSKVTIKRAFWYLQKEGYIERKKGFGYFVTQQLPVNCN